MRDYLQRFRGKKEENKKSEFNLTDEIKVKLDIVNAMHQTMALTISNIAKIYPKQFDMVKMILQEYAFLIEHILVYRDTGDPDLLFKKLIEFMIRSVEGYLDRYEDGEIVDEEKKVKDLIMDGLIIIEEAIIQKEGIHLTKESEVVTKKPIEDWGNKPKIVKRGGMPSLDTPIESIKGIGEGTAEKLRDIGVTTLEQYVEYTKAQAQEKENVDEDSHE